MELRIDEEDLYWIRCEMKREIVVGVVGKDDNLFIEY